MTAKSTLAACAAILGVWLTLAASANAVPPPNILPPPPPPPTTMPSGPSCPAPQNEPFSWSFDNAIGYYGLLPAQQATGATGSPVPTQTAVFGGGTQTLAITTQGCWAFYGDPSDLSTSPFKLLHFSTSQPVEINGIYLVPVNLSSPPTLIVGNDYTLTAFGPPGTDTRYNIEAPAGGSTTGPLTIVGTVDLGAQVYRWDPGSGHLGSFGPSPQGPTFAGQPITGGEISITDVAPAGSTCWFPEAHVTAYLPLPAEFSSGPSSGPPPSGVVNYNTSLPLTCGFGAGGGSGGGVGSGGGGGGNGKPCGGHVCAQTRDAVARFSAPYSSSGGAAGALPAERADLLSNPSQPIHLTVPDLYLGGLEIHNAFLDYEPSTDLWTGGGDMQFADGSVHAAPPPPGEGIGLFGDGSFDFGGAQYNFSPPVTLYTGPPQVDLTEIGVRFTLHPSVITGDATISVADGEVTINGTALVAFGDANEPYTYQPGALGGVNNLQRGNSPITSFAAGISGTVNLNALPLLGSVQLGNGYVFYVSPGYFEFAGNVSQNLFGLVQATGHVQGAIDLHSNPLLYDLQGNVSVCENFPAFGQECQGIDAIVSSKGMGACAHVLIPTFPPVPGEVGFTYAWGDSSPDIQGPFSCDTGPVTVVVSSARDARSARAARAPGPVGVDLPGGVPSTSVRVTGSGGPPRVTITGPHRERLANPEPGRGTVSPNLVIWPEPKLNETLIAIRDPRAGRWTITPLPGSPAITGVSYANGLPAAKISASVNGRDRVLTLHYEVRPRVGQAVTFAERSAGVFRVIGRATGRRGSLRFAPAVGLGRRREIVAMISLAGLPRENMVIAHYVVPAPPRPSTPTQVRVLRAGRDLTVSWLPADRWGCLVFATLSDGHRLLYSMPPMRHSLRISGLAPGIGARITVTDLGQTGNTGAAGVTSLAPDYPGAVTHLTVRRVDRRVVISWRPTTGANRYLVTIDVRGRAPVTLFGIVARPAVTLVKAAHYLLTSGDASQITVRAVNFAGQPGSAAVARFIGRDTPQPPPNRLVRLAVDAID